MNQTVRGIYTPEGLVFGIVKSVTDEDITIEFPSVLAPVGNSFSIFPLLHATVEQTLTFKKEKLMSDYMYEMKEEVEKLFKTMNNLDSGIITPPTQKIIH